MEREGLQDVPETFAKGNMFEKTSIGWGSMLSQM